MDVHVEKLEADVTVTDDVLSPAEMSRLVQAVLQQLRAEARQSGIVGRNTQLGRSATRRPDLLR
jgi:hypothetical protein